MLAVVALAVACALASPAASHDQANARIDPGKGIGGVRLGMTLTQVRAVLGKPNVVNKRESFGFGNEYVEYDWGWGKWAVGFSGNKGAGRVVLVSTLLAKERTREGIGVNTPQTRLKAVYKDRGLRCPSLVVDGYAYARACRLTAASGAITYFPVRYACPAGRDAGGGCRSELQWVVLEVMIRLPTAPKPIYH